MEYMYGNAVRKLTMSYMHLKCSEIEKKKKTSTRSKKIPMNEIRMKT